MSVAIDAAGQAARRGLVLRVPAPDRLLSDVAAWLGEEHADTVRWIERASPDASEAGGRTPVLRAALHPAAPALVIGAEDGGRVSLHAETAGVGPGYERFAWRLLERLGEALAIEWSRPSPGGEEPQRLAVPDRSTAERRHLVWLASTLTTIRDARRSGAPAVHLGIDAGIRVSTRGALVTPLGPRDDDWLDRAIVDPRVAIDILPWWADATDARYLLNRALCLMWTEVRWRRPADDEEWALVDEVLRLLRRAYPLDPALPYPWREWHELLELRGVDEPMAELILARAVGAEAGGDGRIGYRRGPVTLVHEGWAVEIPGSFSARRSDEEWTGRDAGRTITLAATPTGTADGPMPPHAFLDLVAGDLGEDALTHRDGELVGRARLTTDGSSGVGVGVLEGFSAVRGSGAAIRIVFHDPADWQWALDTWRALAPAESPTKRLTRV